ncbi:13804_t:CDS:2, partial [Rhizophagus irregularis]
MLSEKVRDITKRKENNKKAVLRKELLESSKKEKNKEFITWKKNEDIVYSIMNKKSRSKVYDEVGKHLIEYCNGCEFNIGRKLNTGKYLIYIEKDIAIMIKGRKVALENGDSGMKPYMTKENI